MVTASYRSLRNWADTTGAKSHRRPIGGRSDSITASWSPRKAYGGPLVTAILTIIRQFGR